MTQFDFHPIRDRYPLAFDALCRWSGCELCYGWGGELLGLGSRDELYDFHAFEPKLCFDFFDSVGIHGWVALDHMDEWSWHVYDSVSQDRENRDWDAYGIPTRTTSEHACWTRMFGVLDGRLSA